MVIVVAVAVVAVLAEGCVCDVVVVGAAPVVFDDAVAAAEVDGTAPVAVVVDAEVVGGLMFLFLFLNLLFRKGMQPLGSGSGTKFSSRSMVRVLSGPNKLRSS